MSHAGSYKVRCTTSAITLFVLSIAPLAAQDAAVESKDGLTTVTLDGQPILEYRCEPNPTKMYVSRWYTPGGVQVLRDSPHDHVHHHALMYAIGIDDVDFWAEVPPETYGRQVARDLTGATRADGRGRSQAEIRQQVSWVAPSRDVLAEEARHIRAHVGVIPGASLLTWQFALSPAVGKDSIKLWGRHYFGLGLRFVETMDKGSEFLMPKGAKAKSVRGTEKLTRSAWCAVHGYAEGKPITVAMFDAPENERHPATWFTMTAPFAYMGATLNLHEEPLTVRDGKPLRIRYGIAAWDGKIAAESIEQAYRKWLELKLK